MKSHTLPVLALITLAAAAGAQTVPVKRATTSDLFSVGVSYANVRDFNGLSTNQSGYGIDLRASVTGNVFLTASYIDTEKLALSATESISPGTYGIGLGTKLAAGNGSVELSYVFHHIDMGLKSTLPTTTPESLDQHWIKAAYALELGSGFNVAIGVTEILNTESGVDNVTAPELSVGYRYNHGLTGVLSFSTEDALLGLPDAGSTVSFSLRYGF